MKRLAWGLAVMVVVAGAGYFFLWAWPLHDPHPKPFSATGALVIRDARVYVSPTTAPVEHATVLVKDGVIAAVGPDVQAPADATAIACNSCVVIAGFWNVHVHFTESKWQGAAWKSAAVLNAQLADMLTSRGFTTVADVGSSPAGTIPLRRRIESGELLGPKIYTAEAAIYPPHGIPYYLGSLPFFVRWFMPQPESPEEAVRAVERNIARGSDLLKLFTGSYVARGKVLPMPEAIARAAADDAHRHGQLVFSHPSNLAGVRVAMAAGVDVLAHAADDAEGVDRELLASIVAKHMSMSPTLKMFETTVTKKAEYMDPIYAEVRQFHELGGDLLFGTDVGYMTDYSTEDEFRALAKCGLNAMEILRMLTVAPAERFGVAREKGTVEAGKTADLVVLESDPTQDVAAFARVAATVRAGRAIWKK